jgi:hypothetical protein
MCTVMPLYSHEPRAIAHNHTPCDPTSFRTILHNFMPCTIATGSMSMNHWWGPSLMGRIQRESYRRGNKIVHADHEHNPNGPVQNPTGCGVSLCVWACACEGVGVRVCACVRMCGPSMMGTIQRESMGACVHRAPRNCRRNSPIDHHGQPRPVMHVFYAGACESHGV